MLILYAQVQFAITEAESLSRWNHVMFGIFAWEKETIIQLSKSIMIAVYTYTPPRKLQNK